MIVMGEHDAEMTRLIMAVEEKGRRELDAIIAEAERVREGNGEALREIWEQDVNYRKEFFEDQLKNRKYS